MAKPRVHEVAKQLGLTSKEVLAHLEKIGSPVKSHASTIDEALAERVVAELGDGAAPKAPARGAKKTAPAEAVETTSTEAKAPEKKPQKKEAKAPERKAARVSDVPAAPSPPLEADTAPEPLEQEPPASIGRVKVHRGISVKDFAEKIGTPAAEVVKILLGLGEMVTITQSMSDEALLLVAEGIGATVEIVDPGQEEEPDDEEFEPEAEANLVARPPVVTVMGHVDHGKTAILDAIRRTDVAAGEAGGITQHIGAYQVHVDGREVTFIDTPGHEAFTAMRARGAQVTDIAVLVVAADDGVMPQTVEAVDHARAAQVPIVVAVNKVDKPEADPTRVRQQLTDHGLVPEEWGGDTIFVDVSAKQRTNLDGLLEMILLTADVQLEESLKANPDAQARGVVIEAHLDKGRGPVATVLVKRGTLEQGDPVLAGTAWGRVRAMLDENGKSLKAARPGQPAQVLGWQSLPEAGDDFRSVDEEKDARRVAQEREQHKREAELVEQRKVSLQTLLAATREGEIPELNLILKADTQGSVEALDDQLAKLDQSLVKLTILRKGVGAITENDVTLAQASDAIVIGFNVIETGQARPLAEDEGVDVRTYRVIYQAVQDIESAAKGLLGPEIREVPIGQAEVRAVFRVPRAGTIAGCMVIDGVIRRNSRARLARDGTVIYETTIASLKRFKEDAREVAQGYECGIGLEGFQDVKEGDLIQAFEVQEVAR